MTVAQLIEKLKEFDSGMSVEIECPRCDKSAPIEAIDSKGRRFNAVVLS